MMRSHLAGILLTLAVAAGSVQADVVNLDSRPGLPNSLTLKTVAVTPHPSWQPNNPVNPGNPSDHSAVWISDDFSGYGDADFQPYNGATPVVSIFHSFISADGPFTLNVWADDTAEVLLDGISLIDPKFTQTTCSGQPIGCLPGDAGVFGGMLAAGSHQLEFRLFQVGTATDSTHNPFGLLYTGTATAVPEPGAVWLLGGILVAAAGIARKRSRGARRVARDRS